MTDFFCFSKSRLPSKFSCRNVSSLSRGCLQHPRALGAPILNVCISKKLSGRQVRNCQNNPCFPKSCIYIVDMLESNQVIAWWQMGSQIPEPTQRLLFYMVLPGTVLASFSLPLVFPFLEAAAHSKRENFLCAGPAGLFQGNCIHAEDNTPLNSFARSRPKY